MSQNYQYLRPPAKVHQLKHPDPYIMTIEGGKHKRKIFNLVDSMQYDQFQKNQLRLFKQHLRQQGQQYALSDATFIRFLYAGDFKLEECSRRLRVWDEWNKDPNVQMMTPKARNILETGVLYTYGRDPMYRPIIFLNVAKTDLSKHSVDDYFCALNHLLKPVTEYMFVPGRVQNWIMIIDTGGQTMMPKDLIESIVKKLSVVYSSCLQKLFVVNANMFVKLIYRAVSGLLHPDTQKKISVLGSGDMGTLLEYIASDELEMKYGGSLPNLTEYWPIKTTKDYNRLPAYQKDMYEFGGEEVQLFSVLNDSKFFEETTVMQPRISSMSVNQQSRCCCQSDSLCILF